MANFPDRHPPMPRIATSRDPCAALSRVRPRDFELSLQLQSPRLQQMGSAYFGLCASIALFLGVVEGMLSGEGPVSIKRTARVFLFNLRIAATRLLVVVVGSVFSRTSYVCQKCTDALHLLDLVAIVTWFGALRAHGVRQVACQDVGLLCRVFLLRNVGVTQTLVSRFRRSKKVSVLFETDVGCALPIEGYSVSGFERLLRIACTFSLSMSLLHSPSGSVRGSLAPTLFSVSSLTRWMDCPAAALQVSFRTLMKTSSGSARKGSTRSVWGRQA